MLIFFCFSNTTTQNLHKRNNSSSTWPLNLFLTIWVEFIPKFWTMYSSVAIAIFTISFCLVLSSPSVHVGAVSECLATGEDQLSFHCFTQKGKDAKDLACVDTDDRCGYWGKRGECRSNPQYMLIYCRKSCESCISGHAGVAQIAPDPSLRKKVIQKIMDTQIYLKKQADFKAKIIHTCKNQQNLCAQWSVQGECEKNAGWMAENCAAACMKCK